MSQPQFMLSVHHEPAFQLDPANFDKTTMAQAFAAVNEFNQWLMDTERFVFAAAQQVVEVRRLQG